MNVNSHTESKTKEAQSSSDVTPRRFALKYDPPTLVIEYAQQLGLREKLYLQRIRLKKLSASADPVKVAATLQAKYPMLLQHPSVTNTQVERLVRRLVEHMQGAGSKASAGRSGEMPSSPGSPGVAVDPSAVDAALASFLSKTTRPSLAPPPSLPPSNPPSTFITAPGASGSNDPQSASSSTASVEELDSELEALLSLTADTDAPASGPRRVVATMPSSVKAKGPPPATKRSTPEELLRADLQKADPTVVAAAKKSMDTMFEKNRKKPGDEGYVYNVEVEFQPAERSEWDDDSDEEF